MCPIVVFWVWCASLRGVLRRPVIHPEHDARDLPAAAAVWRFKIFRMGEPAIRIDLEVRSYTSSPSYNALSAVALIKNSSRVETVVNEFEWEVRVLSPYTDEAVEDKAQEYTDYYYSETQWVEFPWNVNYKLTQTDARINLEPGESNTVSMIWRYRIGSRRST